MNTIAIKSLRANLSKVADEVAKGESFIVYRRSKPAFKIEPIIDWDDIEEVDEEEDSKGWTSLIDFTEGGKKEGIDIKDFIKLLKGGNGKNKQNS